MQSLKKLIQSQPDIPITKNPQEIDKEYKQYRRNILITIFLSYAIFYLTRKNFAAAIPAMISQTPLTAEDFAAMSSMFYILYGSMKFLSGIVVDKVNPKVLTGPALIAVGAINLLFGASSGVTTFFILYALNAIIQGTSFPPMAKMMAGWFSKNERGRWWSVLESAHNIGGALAPILTGFAIALSGSWRMGFYIPGIISLVMGIIALFAIQDRPRSKGLPTVGEWRNDISEQAHVNSSPSHLSLKKIFIQYILKNPLVWLIIGGDMCVYIARTIFDDWPAFYYTHVHHWDLVKADSLVSWFETGGLVGGIIAGTLSDIIFRSNRWMTGFLFGILLIICLILLTVFQNNSYYITAWLFGIIGFALYGPHMLFAVGCLDVTHKNAAGSVTGFRGMFSYVGAALAGFPVIMIKNSWNWSGVFIYAFAAVIVMTFCLALLAKFHRLKQI